MKRIGILGSGSVAQNLAKGFIQLGYDVMFGTSNPEKIKDFIQQHPTAKFGGFADTAIFGELLVLAIKGKYAIEVLKSVPVNAISGKTVIDTTNPINEQAPVKNVFQYFTNDLSLLEMLQDSFKNVHFVKAFNSVGAELMFQPDFEEKPSMFICGDNDIAKGQVADIVEKFGFTVEDLGKKEAGKTIESLCVLWCIEGLKTNIWNKHAIRIIRRK